MKKAGRIALLLLLSLCLLCSGIGAAGAAESSGNNQQTIAQQVFPRDKVVDVKIIINPDDYQSMLDNPIAEEYKTASVEYNGTVVNNVGVRTKGMLSLSSVANSDSDRYSLKIDFEKYISGQNLFGLTKINLNNNYADPTFMREFLTYELLAKMGVVTPQNSYVNLYINGELKGIFLAVEQVNESFLERNFDNAYGALYKPDGTGSDLKWIDDNIDSYKGLNLKSESSNDDIIVDMLNELNNGSNYEKYINVDAALRYFAVSTVLANMDSYQGSKMHNYYLYEDNGVFSILPWDFNMSFAGFSMGVSKQQLIEMMIDEPTEGAVAERPLVAKLLANDAYRATYHEYVQQVINYLNPDAFEARVNEIAALIGPSVEKDPTKFYTYEQFQQSLTQDVQNIAGLIPFTTSRVENVQKQLDGTLPSSGTGAGMGSTGMGGGRPGGQGGMGGQGQGRLNAQAAQNADGAAQGNAQGQAGMPGVPGAMDGQGGFPGGMNGQGGPGGMNGQGGPGGMGGGGFGGGGPGGMPGMGSTASQSQGSVQKAIETGVTVVILLLACLFIVMFRRNQL